MKDILRAHIRESISSKEALLASDEFQQSLISAVEVCKEALGKGHKILLAGNGGSAADCQHIAAELVGRFEKERPGMAAIALTTDTSALTAIANDYGYENVFSRQLEGLGQEGDVFIGITTSGNSGNIIAATHTAINKKLKTIGLTGNGGKLASITDVCIQVPSSRTAIIQESHIMIGHMLCSLIEAD